MDSVNRLTGGVIVPIMTPFDPKSENIDRETLIKHIQRLAKAGVAGLAVQGSNGEAVHLTHEERDEVTSITREALPDLPIIVGCGAQSTRETIILCKRAHKSGGDFALVLPASYYSSLFKPSSATVIEFYKEVADKSPIPIIIYNYPPAANGIDLNSDDITELSKHQNIVGVKLTCGNTGKLNRVIADTRILRPEFLVLAGSADFTTNAMVGGADGILAGLANIAPRTCVKLVRLCQEERYREARDLQEIVAKGDWQVIKTGVVGTKSVLNSYYGYGGVARSPLPIPSKEMSLNLKKGFEELMKMEVGLEKEQGLKVGLANVEN